ncbi:hypothetical protein AQUCO_02000613v1 [Aquilegia coerulea]|uniref:DUF547 domain-containing protein n=1 Tax=Aquilegia coerulea TaxID=218851 RepID=A0A2G5DII7_AQUCA|nr:hypothetical protein AQUCO_02000613v1 [Aquilegia coerulea]
MLFCLKAESAIGNDEDDGQLHLHQQQLKQCDCDLYNNNPQSPSPSSSSSLLLPTMNNIGSTIHRYIISSSSSSKKMKANNGFKSPFSDASSTSSSSSSSSSTSISVNNSGIFFLGKMENTSNASNGDRGNDRRGNMSDHRPRLEQDEAKANDEQNGNERTGMVADYRSQLEQDIKLLQAQLKEETDLHLLLASVIVNSTEPFSDPLIQLPDKAQKLFTDIAELETTVSKLEEEAVTLRFHLTQEKNERCLAEYHLRQSPSCSSSPLTCSHVTPKELVTTPSMENREGTTLDDLLVQADVREWSKDSYLENLRQQPNQLSEEMVRCMRNIFLCLTDSSKFSSSGCMASPASPQGHLSHSSIASFSDSSAVTASKQSSSLEHEVLIPEDIFDPYQVQGKLNWTKYIGTYSNAAEVSWMSVGEKQLEYAAGALKRFRLLVEQLAKVNPACLNTSERLAFWINLYNALIMHAYLAYGVPRSDIKFFSLTQKAAYTVGGHSLSAADIEYIILKMRPPSHRPQIALVLALHKFKLPEEQRKYSIENSEPLVAFALSCGMHSSPAVRIYLYLFSLSWCEYLSLKM